MQPIGRGTQIRLMREAEERHEAAVKRYLRVPAVREMARSCAFGPKGEFTTKQVRVVRAG